ncbi:hypothetical protein BpHYR1_023387 [Brachionus plicatilis]|uniref:Uncharacterized protein n=1 Tax=Brachionus plicatilis TaxID=10195 RepID=A0A3M7QJ81_BRAPC|nr:hypothetical protein BpHYR1_023387 [Brachionus plicatilis]
MLLHGEIKLKINKFVFTWKQHKYVRSDVCIVGCFFCNLANSKSLRNSLTLNQILFFKFNIWN